MKKLLLLFTFLSITSIIFAQVSKTVNLASAGTLSTSLTSDELNTITNLTLTGNIDARDFKTMRDKMPLLAVLDISGIKVEAYSGTGGTSWNTNYAADVVPENAFLNPDTSQGKKSLISVVLPSSVISIGNVAFRRSGLTTVTIPSSVTSIGNSAFEACSGLTTVTIPSSVTSIGQGAFGYCSKLATVNIPSSVTSIQKSTFQGCSALTAIAIPSSVTSIGDFAFGSCSGLTTVSIPSLVTSIGNSAFFGCSGMTSVSIPNSVISIGKGAFQSCSALTIVTIPSSVTSIGDFAFRGCSGMTSVTIPSSVTSVREGAFENCSALTSITVAHRTPVNLGMSYNVFNNVDKFSCTLYVPLGSKSAYQTALGWKDFYNIVEKDIVEIKPTISINLTAPGTLSTSLTSEELNNVTNLTITGTIDARDFKTMRDEMPLLAVLDLSGVTIAAYNGTEGTSWNTNYAANAVPENAFINPTTLQGKISLISVVLPSSVTSIGDSAFRFCSGLTTIAIPSSVNSIGNLAFQSCSGLITVDSNNPNYSGVDGVLYNKAQTILIQCPISKIGSFTIPSSVTSIGDGAFLSCSGLTTITIPSSVTSIGGGAFSFCSGLKTIAIPFSVTSIGNGAFAYCSGLTTVAIPSSVTSIGNSAFLSCKGMTTVTIPSSVTSIGNGAFNYCSGLTSITTSKITPLDLGSSTNVFSQVDKTTCTLYVPTGSKSAYQVADQWKDFKNIVEKDITGLSSEINNQTLSIYPNPTKGKIKILFDQVPEKGTTLTVNDFTGKTILTQLIQNKEEQIDLEGNSPGVYLIRTNMKDFKIQKVILK